MTLARVSNVSSARAKTTTCPDFPFLFAAVHSALVASMCLKFPIGCQLSDKFCTQVRQAWDVFVLIMAVMKTRRQNFTAGINFNTTLGLPLVLEFAEKSAALMTNASSNMAAHKV